MDAGHDALQFARYERRRSAAPPQRQAHDEHDAKSGLHRAPLPVDSQVSMLVEFALFSLRRELGR